MSVFVTFASGQQSLHRTIFTHDVSTYITYHMLSIVCKRFPIMSAANLYSISQAHNDKPQRMESRQKYLVVLKTYILKIGA